MRYLQEATGIPPERLSAVGFGPYRPLESNDTPEGRARNRRIEIKLVPLESPLVGGQEPAVDEAPTEAPATEQEAEPPAEQPAAGQATPVPATGTSTP